MALTERQELTIKHLEGIGITKVDDIIKFCLKKLAQSGYHGGRKYPNSSHQNRRKHSKDYYYQIIDHYNHE